MQLSNLKLALVAATGAVAMTACAPAAEDPQTVFFDTLKQHCGNAYAGEVTIGDEETDATWIENDIIIEVRECHENRIRIPLHVGDNHSRTWILTRTHDGLELKHDHREADGSHDELTMYGGDTFTPGTTTSQSFPADEESKQLFSELGYTDSIGNTWWLTFPDEDTLRYRLVRDNREFQVDVDLTQTVDAPQAPWGWEDDYNYN